MSNKMTIRLKKGEITPWSSTRLEMIGTFKRSYFNENKFTQDENCFKPAQAMVEQEAITLTPYQAVIFSIFCTFFT